jgi:GT2 family glycosyltransferase
MKSQGSRRMPDVDPLLVSIVIVSYNGRSYLGDCLSSVLDQELSPDQYEVVVVDNASSDDSAEFVEQHFPGVRLIRLDRNYGPIQAAYRVLPQLRGKHLAFLHQDTIVHRRWLVELLDVLNSHPQAGLVESNIILPQWPEYNPDNREGFLERAYICDVNSFCFFEFRTEPVTPNSPPIPVLSAYGPSILVSQEIIEELDFFCDPNLYMHSDDLDIGLRVNIAGYQALMAPRSVVYHNTDRWHFKWDIRSLRKAFYATRNIVLVFYQISYTSEFLRLLPRVLFGKLLKAGEDAHSLVGRLIKALIAVPLVMVCLLLAIFMMPAYRERRKMTLRRRTVEPGWLIERFANIHWKADPNIWNQSVTSSEEGKSISELEWTSR